MCNLTPIKIQLNISPYKEERNILVYFNTKNLSTNIFQSIINRSFFGYNEQNAFLIKQLNLTDKQIDELNDNKYILINDLEIDQYSNCDNIQIFIRIQNRAFFFCKIINTKGNLTLKFKNEYYGIQFNTIEDVKDYILKNFGFELSDNKVDEFVSNSVLNKFIK